MLMIISYARRIAAGEGRPGGIHIVFAAAINGPRLWAISRDALAFHPMIRLFIFRHPRATLISDHRCVSPPPLSPSLGP